MERCGGGRLRFLVLAAVASLGLAAASLGLGAFESPLSSAAKLDAALLPRSLSAREPERRKGGTGRDAATQVASWHNPGDAKNKKLQTLFSCNRPFCDYVLS